MDTLFIDTSIFESNNFFEGRRIKELFKLSKQEKISVIIPEITFDEIKNRINKNIDSAQNKFERYRKDTRILRNIPSLKDRFKDIDFSEIKREAEIELNDTFKDSKIRIIEYSDLNLKQVFKKYFNQEFPFSSGKKNCEFPDALALSTVEKWCAKTSTNALIFSKDKDILNYKSKYLTIHEDFDVFLDQKLREIEEYEKTVKKIDQYIAKRPEILIKESNEWFENELLDDYDLYNDIVNWMEVHDVFIYEVISEIAEYEIMEIDSEYIAVQLKMEVCFKVGLTIDDQDYMIKDDDTKEWIYLDTTVVSHEDSKFIDIEVVFYPNEEDDQLEVEIEEINHGQKLKI